MSVTMLINVNTADKEELKQIPGVGERVARLLIQFREVYGVIKKEALNLALRGKLSAEALDMIDFSVPRQEDPFDIDLSCIPAVPKTNSWEPLVSFAHQTAARQSRYQVGKSFAMSASHFAEQETSPKLAGASSMHESQESRSCRTDSRPVSQCDEEDAKPSVSKTSSSKSANHSSGKSDGEVEKKNRTASQRHSRSSQGGMGSCRSKSPKAQSSSSRSRSPSSRRHSRKHSPKKTRRRHGKGSSSVSRSRSHSRSVSRSRSVERHSRKFVKKGMKKKKHDSSTSTSRSRSAGHRSRKSDTKVENKKKQDSSRSDSSSKSVRHSSRKSDYKTKKSKSQRKKGKHSRSKSRSASRSSSRSASRSSSRSLSRSHKRRTKTKGDKSRVNKHEHPLSSKSRSSSRSSSRSNSRTSHKKKIKTRRAKSKVHKHKRHALSCSESQSRSRSRSRSHRTKTRSKKTKGRPHRHSPHSNSDTDSSVDRCLRHGNPRKHPKALRFDGNTNWLSFKEKFDSYRKVMRWSEEESKDYLMWSLEGKALDFLTITKIDLEKYCFRKIMKKLETRFGVKELTETSKAKFRQAFQKQEVSLEDWADRVMTLATPAFVDLPEDHLKKEAIARFCRGCTDKEAAKHACFEQPETMEEVLNSVKHHQYISQAVDGKKVKREYEASVNAVQSPSEARVEQLIRSALRDVAAKLQESSTSLSSSSETEEKAKKKRSSSQCFICKKFGHFKKDCRVYQAWLSKKQESKSEDSEGHPGQKQ